MNSPKQEDGVVRETVETCDLCGGRELPERYRLDDYLFGLSQDDRLVKCADCGLGFISPRPVPASIGRFYPREYEEHQQAAILQLKHWQRVAGRRGGPRTLWERLLVAFYQYYSYQFLPPLHGSGKLLDVGCANGTFLDLMRLLGWDTHGCEPSQGAAAIAAGKGHHVAAGMGAEELDFPPGSFDLVYVWHVLEHTHSPRDALARFHRVLKPGGRLVLAVPNAGGLQARLFGRYWSKMEPPRHLYQFTRPTLRRYLAEAGFGDIRVATRTGATSWVRSVRFLANGALRANWRREPGWLISLLETPTQLAGVLRFLGGGSDLRAFCVKNEIAPSG